MSATEPSAPAPRRGRLYKYVFLIACATIAWHVMRVEEHAPRQSEATAASPQPAAVRPASGRPVALGASTFDSTVATGIHVVDFWAEWCGPCHTQAPILDRLAQSSAGVFGVGKVNVDHEGDLADRFDISSIPTLVILKDGREVRRFVGVTDEATLKEAVRSLR